MYQLVLLTLLSVVSSDSQLLAQASPAKSDAKQPAAAADAATPAAKADGEAGEKPAADAAAPDASAEKAPVEGEAAAENTDEASAESEPEPSWLSNMMSQGAIGYLNIGGVFMWPLLLLGVIGGGVFIERYRSLQMLRTDTGALRAEVHDLQEDRVEEAYRLCDGQQGPVPAILATGLRRFMVLRRLGYDPGRIEEQVIKAMDDYSVHIVAALERHLPILATISSVAPMIGFLGTVQGMIVAFDDIVRTMGETNIVVAAAAGIKVSLLTTCFGLIIGIPTFMAFNYFTSLINRFVLEVEESATELIEVVTLQMTLQGSSEENSSPVEESQVPAFEQ